MLLAAVAVGVVVSGGVFVAQANQATTSDKQPSSVERNAYPGKARIEAEDNVKLIAGDGHIVYVDCSTPQSGALGLIEVHSSDATVGKNKDGVVCFKVTGNRGYVTLALPDVFEIRGDGRQAGAGHKGTAEVVSEAGERKTVNLNPNGSAQVGVGEPGGKPSTLVRLEITG